jgi:serine/threonine protein phosphatase 1
MVRHDWRPAIRALDDGQAVAVVGDVHGRDDLFEILSGALLEEIADNREKTFVQLGDMVDRGPGSLAALRRMKAGLPGVATVALKGNHEDRLVTMLADPRPETVDHWLGFGGEDVAVEAGVRVGAPGWRDALVAAIGDDLLAWIAGLPTLHRVGDLVFVHAGLDPDKPLRDQDPETLMWTRKRWLESAGPYADGVAVIHGHTPQPGVDLAHPHRINLDTGAYKTGTLSGLAIVGDRMRVVQAVR